MANAPIDANSRRAIICASNADGKTIVQIKANPSNSNTLKVDDGITGSDFGSNHAALDENSTPVWLALSSAGDGSLVEVYGDPATGKVLVDSV